MKELPVPTFALSPIALPRGSLRLRPQAQNAVCNETAAKQKGTRIQVLWARHLDEVREAQRLRYAVFAGEMGAQLNAPVAGHDIDRFDDYCEHLLVRDAVTRQVIGTYR